MNKPPPYVGRCLCGDVSYRVSAPPINVRACHCHNCQRSTGAPFWVRAVFEERAVERTGKLIRHPSSKRLVRASCARCGALVFAEPIDRPQHLAIGTATLDDTGALVPDMHIWTSRMIGWIKLDDGLPQYLEGAP